MKIETDRQARQDRTQQTGHDQTRDVEMSPKPATPLGKSGQSDATIALQQQDMCLIKDIFSRRHFLRRGQ